MFFFLKYDALLSFAVSLIQSVKTHMTNLVQSNGIAKYHEVCHQNIINITLIK